MTARPPLYTRQLAAFAAVKLVLHVIVNATTQFGFQRDEFLYFSMGRHLHLWRMDFPPGIALAANGVRALLGDSMTAIRMVPALAGTAVLVVAVLIARELGGGRFAQGLTALALLTSPLFLRTSTLFQPVVLDQLCWTLALYCLVRLGGANEPRWWMLLGASLGLGLLVKFSALIFGAAVLLAMLATLAPGGAAHPLALDRRGDRLCDRQPEHRGTAGPALSRRDADGAVARWGSSNASATSPSSPGSSNGGPRLCSGSSEAWRWSLDRASRSSGWRDGPASWRN